MIKMTQWLVDFCEFLKAKCRESRVLEEMCKRSSVECLGERVFWKISLSFLSLLVEVSSEMCNAKYRKR
jgi:hypothetical protein